MTYAEYCAEKCEWCAKGWGLSADGRHVKGHEPVKRCTAPTRDQFEQFLNEKYDAAFNEGTYLHKCLEQASLRIAELERENAELKAKLKAWNSHPDMRSAATQSAGEQK